jgi:hypothetical protein
VAWSCPRRAAARFTRAVLAAHHWPLADRLALLGAASGWLLRRFRCPPGWTVQQLCGHLPRPVRRC